MVDAISEDDHRSRSVGGAAAVEHVSDSRQCIDSACGTPSELQFPYLVCYLILVITLGQREHSSGGCSVVDQTDVHPMLTDWERTGDVHRHLFDAVETALTNRAGAVEGKYDVNRTCWNIFCNQRTVPGVPGSVLCKSIVCRNKRTSLKPAGAHIPPFIRVMTRECSVHIYNYNRANDVAGWLATDSYNG